MMQDEHAIMGAGSLGQVPGLAESPPASLINTHRSTHRPLTRLTPSTSILRKPAGGVSKSRAAVSLASTSRSGVPLQKFSQEMS